MSRSLVAAVNFHLIKPCNAKCKFCFATFREVRGRLVTDDAARVIDQLADAGCEKLTFAGGEPTLHPDLGRLLRHAKARGLVTCVVTNGFRLDRVLDTHADALDWVGLSVDSSDEEVQRALGRGAGDHVAAAVRLADRCRDLGVRLKLNTVVTSATWTEDMTGFVRRMRPERWKVFQVLPIAGQNDGSVEGPADHARAVRRVRGAPPRAGGGGPRTRRGGQRRDARVVRDGGPAGPVLRQRHGPPRDERPDPRGGSPGGAGPGGVRAREVRGARRGVRVVTPRRTRVAVLGGGRPVPLR
jgi:pyruvate-formate lyase-activating enzyme